MSCTFNSGTSGDQSCFLASKSFIAGASFGRPLIVVNSRPRTGFIHLGLPNCSLNCRSLCSGARPHREAEIFFTGRTGGREVREARTHFCFWRRKTKNNSLDEAEFPGPQRHASIRRPQSERQN